MTMPARVRTFALAMHVMFSVGWIGAVLAYLALGVAAETSRDVQTARGAWIAMELIGWYVLVPLAVASLLTGLVLALGTRWGLFRYYWVLLAFVLSTLATVVLVLHMPTVSSLADVARGANRATLDELGGDVAHSTLGLVVLVVILVLNVVKPRGMTRYGWRKQGEQRRITAAVGPPRRRAAVPRGAVPRR